MSEKRGRLEVRLVDTRLANDPSFDYTKLPPGDYAQLTISDSGIGMSAELLERVFEPFYTTKADGEGTGLGLSVVLGIMSSQDGAITVKEKKYIEDGSISPLPSLSRFGEKQSKLYPQCIGDV